MSEPPDRARICPYIRPPDRIFLSSRFWSQKVKFATKKRENMRPNKWFRVDNVIEVTQNEYISGTGRVHIRYTQGTYQVHVRYISSTFTLKKHSHPRIAYSKSVRRPMYSFCVTSITLSTQYHFFGRLFSRLFD